MTAFVPRCERTTKVQEALVTQALELEALANRLVHLRQQAQADRVRAAGQEAAQAVVALGGSSRWPELWLFFPDLPAPHHFSVKRKIALALGEDTPAGMTT